MHPIAKNVFIKGETRIDGSFEFTVDPRDADLSIGQWRAKIGHLLVKPVVKPEKNVAVSFAVDFRTSSVINSDGSYSRQPLKLALVVIPSNTPGGVLSYIDMSEGGHNPFLSFNAPPSTLCLYVKDEEAEKPFACKFIINIIIERTV